MTEIVPESASLTRLRNAWLESIHVSAGDACLAADWVWDAVTGQQRPADLEAGLAHVTQCASCAEAWRVAHELAVGTGQVRAGRRTADAWGAWRVWLPAAAAVVVLLAGTGSDRGWFDRPSTGAGDANVIRGASAALSTAMPDPQACDRSDCRLSWTDAGTGARYSVRVTTSELAPVAFVNDLQERTFTVPATALGALAKDAEVLWQVEALLPDGRRVSSATFPLTVR